MVKISVVIPALNEEKYISTTLEGLNKQTFKDFEIIVADGNSQDRTRQIAKRYGRVVIEKRKGIGVGRNAGARIAKGEILVFLDADTKPSKDLLKIYSAAFNNGIVAATGPILPLEKVGADVGLGYLIVSILFVKLSILVGKPSIVGSNFAVKKSTFNKVHGFNPNLLTYEDYDLSDRLKKYGKIAYLNDAEVLASARRVMAWGVFGYFIYHVENMFRWHTIRKPRTDYPLIR